MESYSIGEVKGKHSNEMAASIGDFAIVQTNGLPSRPSYAIESS